MNKNRKIFLIVTFFVLVFLGGWLFFEGSNVAEPEEKEEVTKTGNLIFGNPGLSTNWHISYEEPGKPGLFLELNISDKKPNCIGNPNSCASFFQEDDSIAGSRVILYGNLSDNVLTVSLIEFINDSEIVCNFNLSDFPANITQRGSYSVDFSTKPEAVDFQTRIKETVSQGPNFAGDFVYIEWGCGTNCGAGAIVNPFSGHILEYGIINSHGVNFSRDSRLLIVNPPEALSYIGQGDLFENEKSKYFLMQKDGLYLLCEK